ncbi:helix-hairpin-helix domain-containing protein [Pseudoteredinibacter isoporae]|uniref:Putative flap endonuclease-1-like 5' DNA nuclease n=1 Tax=Pseudoteredinibacter isoporae TaxID=570281 RepID=A0A7X0JW38_9GAMM|nr:helix-hairpin-helix domain-containing protein [Pseudoteredinibacter isoporae]MBB6523340.1 putative flap endonuclease-1-like 5' DNA nuclease [Pseudoteredinibacter isoporae]NHO88854.1 helix-hairpin-helix domain-containing protein [Pseudoteredinibacter isoporae]NIB24438.1 helix-hairpin-helix domain-containing protein [Pseudoteredinibacter isoporae]
MTFNQNEKDKLLSLKGVGPSVIQRLEEIGISSFSELRKYRTEEITERVASMLNTTCWKNSPQAKSAISAAIELAKEECP